jgi:hypothetical protein
MIFFQFGQNVSLARAVLLNDIRITGPKRGCTYHGNVAENSGEESEVEGTHASVAVCCIVRSALRKGRTRYLQEASGDYCIAKLKSAKLEGVKTG